MGKTISSEWVKGIILLDGGYSMPMNKSDGEVESELLGYVSNYQFDSWDAFLEQERKHIETWDELNQRIALSTMKENNGLISLKVDPSSAAKAYILCSHFSPLNVMTSQKHVLLLRATLPIEMAVERERSSGLLAEQLENLYIVDVPHSGHDVLTDNRKFVVDSIWSFVDSIFVN